MSEPHRLKKPIVRKDFEIKEIVIGAATGDTMLLVDEFRHAPVRLSMEMIAQLAEVDGRRSEISFADVRKMVAEDIAALGEIVAAALPDGPAIGKTA
jgi:hypothetical protein